MPDYTTHYVFEISVQGNQAVQQAQNLRRQIEQALGGTGNINIGGIATGAAAAAGGTVGGGGGVNVNVSLQQMTQVVQQLQATATALNNVAAAMQRVRTAGGRAGAATGGGAGPVATTAQPVPALEAMAGALQAAEVRYFGLRRLSYGLQSVARDMTTSAMATYRAMSQMVDGYLEYSDTMTRAAMAMELPVEMNDKLTASVRGLSTELGKFSASQLLEGMRLWAAGTGETVQNESDLNRVLKETVSISQLAAVNSTDLGQAVDYVGGIMSEFGLKASDVPDIVETLNFQSMKTFATINDMGEAFKYVGPIASELGDTQSELAVIIGDLANSNIQASMSGRALRQMYSSLMDPAKEVESTLNGLLQVQSDVGQGWRDIVFPQGQFMGVFQFLDLLAAATENYTKAEKEQALAAISTTNELPALLSMVEAVRQGREKGINYYRAAWKEQEGIMDDEVRAWQELQSEIKGTTYSLQNKADLWTQTLTRWEEGDAARANNLKNRWQNTFDQIGQTIFEQGIGSFEDLASVIEEVGNLVESNPGIVKLLMFGTLMDYGLGTAVGKIGEFLQAVASVAVIIHAWPGIFKAIASILVGLAPWLVAIGGAAAYGIGAAQMGKAAGIQGWTTEALKAVAEAPPTGYTAGQVQFQMQALEELQRREQLARQTEQVAAQQEKATKDWIDAVTGKAYKTEFEQAMAEHRDMLREMGILRGQAATEGGAGITPAYPRPAITDAEMQAYKDKYGGILKSYESHLRSMEQRRASFEMQEKWSDEEHLREVNETREERYSERADLFMDYAKEVLSAERDFARQEELAARDHQDALTDLEKDAQKQRLSQQIQFQRAMAESERQYQQSVADSYEQFAYDQGLAAEDAQRNRAQMLRDFQRSEADAAEQYAYSQAQTDRDFQRSEAQSAEEYQYQRAQSQRDFERGEAEAAEEYQYQRAQAIKDFQEQEAEAAVEAEKDKNNRLADLYHEYLKDIERQRLEHMDRMFDLVAARDARGLLNEVRDWRRYQSQRREDYDEAVSDVQKQAAEEREQRKNALDEQLKDMEEAEARRREKAQAAFQQQLADAVESEERRRQQAVAAHELQEQDAAEAEARRREQAQAAYALQLQDFEEAEALREQLAQQAFDRQLALMQRAHEREIAQLQARHAQEMADLELQIAERRQALEDDYQQQRLRAKEEQAYRMAEMKADFDEKVREFDYETHQMILKMNIRYAKEKELRRIHFEEELAQTEKFARDELKAQLDGLTLPESELNRIFMERMRQLTLYLGRELEFVTKYYNEVTAKMAAVSTAASIAMSDPDASGAATTSGTTSKGATTGTSVKSSGTTTTISTGNAIAGAGGTNAGSAATTATGQQIVPYQKMIQSAASAYGLPWYKLAGQLAWESGFNPNAKGGSGEQGMAQFMPGTWTWRIGSGNPFDAKTAINAMAKYMALLQGQASSQGKSPIWEFALGGYNAGEGALKKAAKLSDFPKITYGTYIPQVQKLANQFASGSPWIKNWYGGKGLATGGIAWASGKYTLAEREPEVVIPFSKLATPGGVDFWDLMKMSTKGQIPELLRGGNWSDVQFAQLMQTSVEGKLPTWLMGRGMSTPLSPVPAMTTSPTKSQMVIQVNQQHWSFHGTFTQGDRQWFQRAAKDAAYRAVEEVVSNA